MGYLTDNVPIGQTWADCPELYPYALVVEWIDGDKFGSPKANDVIKLAVLASLPDVEDWQTSVDTRPGLRRIKLRFKNAGTRTTARNKIESDIDSSVFVTNVVELNPPDLPVRGVA